ncbi:mitochondrial GTPase 1-like [Daphnia pulex]|nr:mitochondrial GTPase 1-like [Daphnia pulex]
MKNSVRWQAILPELKKKFRNEFVFPEKKSTQWFPGHMNRGMKQMEAKLKLVDCVLEVHDARIPISGRNPNLTHSFVAAKPYILVLNKCDLIPSEYQSTIMSALKERENIQHIIFTNSKLDTCPGLKEVTKRAAQLITETERYNRSDAVDYNLMVFGVPNVGKSSLINALRGVHMRKKRVLQVAPEAGLTKNVHERIRVCNSPAVYLFDTPGIMNPRIATMDVGMRLASCASFKDHLVGEESVVDYLLFWLNKNEEFGYVDSLGLEAPTDNVTELLFYMCVQRNLRRKIRHVDGTYKEYPDFKSAAQRFLSEFRSTNFGKILLDKDLLDSPVNVS